MFPFEAWIGGVRQPLGGLASVASAPWARRGGHVAALLVRWLERLHDGGVAWCAEQPFDPRFYARFGFQSVPNGQAVEIAPELFGADRPPDAQNVTDGELSAVKTLHAAFARRYGFALTRDDDARDAWGRLLRPWAGAPRHVYLLQDAYLVFHLGDDGGRLHVTDFAYTTPEARARVWSLVGAFRGQARQVRIHLPPGEPLLVDTQARHAVRSPLIQVRLVDLAAALAPLRAPRESRWRHRAARRGLSLERRHLRADPVRGRLLGHAQPGACRHPARRARAGGAARPGGNTGGAARHRAGGWGPRAAARPGRADARTADIPGRGRRLLARSSAPPRPWRRCPHSCWKASRNHCGRRSRCRRR